MGIFDTLKFAFLLNVAERPLVANVEYFVRRFEACGGFFPSLRQQPWHRIRL
jgi:hypothetical protein